MPVSRKAAINFTISGWTPKDGEPSPTDGAAVDAEARLLGGSIKHAVRLRSARAGGDLVTIDAVPDEDVVVLDIAGGPSLILHPETARDLLLAQSAAASRGAKRAGDEATDPNTVAVPAQLDWNSDDIVEASRGATRGLVGNVILKAFRVITGLGKRPLANIAANAIVEKFDGRVEAGVYALGAKGLTPLKGTAAPLAQLPPAPAGEPTLILVHGTFSDTAGTFSKLWAEHPDLVSRLFTRYDNRVFALDHPTLGVSPIANALTLARALPDGARLHLVTHSRGGLVAEVLARVCADPDAGIEEFAGKEYKSQRDELGELASIVKKKGLRVERIVRVACPARGTLLASNRLDAYLSVTRWALQLAGVPVAPELVEFLGEVARRRADPAVIPGLAAQIPDSPLVRWLHATNAPLAGDLRVVAGDLEGDSVGSWLKTLVSDGFFWTDNDLVVQTRSMYGGPARANASTFVLDQGGSVSHFNYFSNKRTAEAIVDGLVADVPKDFRLIGPLSAAGTSSTGVRAAPTIATENQTPAQDRPAVILLPDVFASDLAIGKEPVWPNWRFEPALAQFTANSKQSRIAPAGVNQALYGDLITYLGKSHEVIPFAYDWRLPLEVEGRRLAKEVDDALEARAKTGTPVRLLCHGMGGLLARAMWLESAATWTRMMSVKGVSVVMLGAPNDGSWTPMRTLTGDEMPAVGFGVMGSPFDGVQTRELLASMPGFMQLQAALLERSLKLSSADAWKAAAASDLELATARSPWHTSLRQQQDALRWGLPDQGVLDLAASLRERFDAQRDTELAPFVGRIRVVVGTSVATVVRGSLENGELQYLEADGAGDGVVAPIEASLPGARTWRLACTHDDLPRTTKAFAAYLALLGTGETAPLDELTLPARGDSPTPYGRLRPARRRGAPQSPSRGQRGLPSGDSRVRAQAQDQSGAALHITVVNGDLTFIRHPLFLGHYRSTRLSGAEAVMDNAVGGAMQRSLDAGLYPTRPGTHQVFKNTIGDPENPWRLPRPEAVIIVGLGAEGELRGTDLVETVRLGVLAWAHRRMEEHDMPSVLEMSATLIGSGGSGISAGQSAQLIAQGVSEANERLTSAGWPAVDRLRLVELYRDRATEAWRALKIQAGAAPTKFILDGTLECGVGALPRPLDASYRGASYDFISAQAGDVARGSASIDYSLDTKRARTEVRGKSLQSALVYDLIKVGANDENTDDRIGGTLFRLLIPLEVTPFLSGMTEMLLEVDAGTAGIPWELLDVPSGGGDTRPWAIRSKLLRKMRTTRLRERPTDADAEASILVIGEPAVPADKGFGRLPGARAEATAVERCLANGLGAERVRSLISPPDKKKSGADNLTVVHTVLGQPWRVVHISGHGEPPSKGVDGAADITGGVVLSNGYLGPNEIGSMDVVPELVFVNCCFLAQRDEDQLLGKMHMIEDRAQFAATVADKLIEIGVRCVVAAGWAVDDAAASAFATTFYDELVNGRRFMDAVNEARIAAYSYGGNTWAAYQCYGDPDWTLNPNTTGTQRATRSMADEFEGVVSAPALQLALETIAVVSTYQKRDKSEQIAKLTYLEARYGTLWGDEGAVADAFGHAWKAVGDRPTAIRWFERAAAANDGAASLSAVEQIANQRALQAWSTVSKERDTGTKASIRKAAAQARKEIKKSQELLGRLNEIQPTMERAALLGSAYKRLAMIEMLAGDTDEARKATSATKDRYAQAEKLGNDLSRDDVSYPALNRLWAELVLNMGNASWKGFKSGQVAAVRKMVEAKASKDPDFWTVVDLSGLVLLETLAKKTLAKDGAKIEAELQVHFGRVSSPWMWSSVNDQLEFVLQPYLVHADAAEKKAARSLLALLARLSK